MSIALATTLLVAGATAAGTSAGAGDVGGGIVRWLALPAVFTVMLSLGMMLTGERVAEALRRRGVLVALLFCAVVPPPLLAFGTVLYLGVTGPVAVGVMLMAISPGAPVALRRALDAGSPVFFAPTLHLAIVLTAVVSVPACVWVLDRLLDAGFEVTTLDIARQVFVAQLLPLGIGAAIRAARPAFAARAEPVLTRISNVLLLALLAACTYELGPAVAAQGWSAVLLGAAFTAVALVCGRAFGGWRSPYWPSGSVATAMRNPGLALVIATVNRSPPDVTAAIFGYAIGLLAVMTAFIAWRQQRIARRR